MALAIRKLGHRDRIMVEELVDLFAPEYPDPLAPGASGAVAFLTDGNTFMFGAYDDHDAVGWLWGAHIRRPNGYVMTYVHELDVVESHRRRGIATLLMQAGFEEGRQRGSYRLWLITRSSNEGGRTLYESLGGDDGGRDESGWRSFAWQL